MHRGGLHRVLAEAADLERVLPPDDNVCGDREELRAARQHRSLGAVRRGERPRDVGVDVLGPRAEHERAGGARRLAAVDGDAAGRARGQQQEGGEENAHDGDRCSAPSAERKPRRPQETRQSRRKPRGR